MATQTSTTRCQDEGRFLMQFILDSACPYLAGNHSAVYVHFMNIIMSSKKNKNKKTNTIVNHGKPFTSALQEPLLHTIRNQGDRYNKVIVNS